MDWLALIIGALSGLFISLILFLFTKNNKIRLYGSLVLIALSIIITKNYVMPSFYAWDYAKTIRNEHPLFDLLAIKAPNDFNAYIEKIKKEKLSNPDGVGPDPMGVFINQELAKFLPYATNASLYHYANTMINLYKNAINIDPILVLNMEFPQHFIDKIDFKKLDEIPWDLINQVLNAKSEIIQSAIKTPQAVLTDNDVKQIDRLMEKILNTLANQYGDNVLTTFTNPDDPALDKKTAATIVISFYENVIAQGETGTGRILKYIFKVKNNK